MVSLKFSALALAALQAVSVIAQGAAEELKVEDLKDPNSDDLPPAQQKAQQRTLSVDIKTSFPQSEIFGIKLVNGHATRAVLDITNNEPSPVLLTAVGGTLLTPKDLPGSPDPPVVVRNLTAQQFSVSVPGAGGKESVTYAFATEMHPQDLSLNLVALLQASDGMVFPRVVFNETVAVVEAPISIFDPQIIFLYLFLAAAFGGTVYFIYTTWITTLFPQQKRRSGGASTGLGGKGGERAKRSSGGSKKVDSSDAAAVIGGDGPAVASASGTSAATGGAAYDESWIPAGHLKKPEARRVAGGRPKSRAA